jgi:23S rRNA (cytidine1920-2'-O)/16S rRNA (cytidine1409-2'-O)-methyltransferase
MRADKFFAEKFGSRTKSAEAIEKGLVLVNGKTIRPKDEVNGDEEISFLIAEESFVSNGGYKLARALKEFSIDCRGKIFADIGASTGGFCDCLLQNGAKMVYAIDVGESLLHESLQNDSRIVRMENTNARYLEETDFETPIDGVTADVSFISLKLILPAIKRILSKDGIAFVLIKPQFECEKKNIGKSGIVHPSAHAGIVKKILEFCLETGLYPFGIVNAPVRKGKNIEYVLYLSVNSNGYTPMQTLEQKVKDLVKMNSEGKLA